MATYSLCSNFGGIDPENPIEPPTVEENEHVTLFSSIIKGMPFWTFSKSGFICTKRSRNINESYMILPSKND